MSKQQHIDTEELAAAAFSRQSAIFDQIYSPNLIIQYKRDRVRSVVNKLLVPNSNILELNAGTGEDTVYFASNGHRVHATDISEGMLKQLTKKVNDRNLQANVTIEQCSFTELQHLNKKGPYDLIFSNFAGLNCTGRLGDVLKSFTSLLSENGLLVLVILPPFCLWETMLALRGNFKAAFRRFGSKNGVKAHIEGVDFTCWYYKPSFIVNQLKDNFDVLGIEGLCTIVPPSYFENFPHKHPRAYKKLQRLEDKFKTSRPWRNIGDYYIISLQKKQ